VAPHDRADSGRSRVVHRRRPRLPPPRHRLSELRAPVAQRR
jgi:hypothetical protein